MSEHLYRFADKKFQKTEFANRVVDELVHGPYAMKFDCHGFGEVIFCGLNDDLILDVIRRGKIWEPIATLVDMWRRRLSSIGFEGDLLKMMYKEVQVELDKLRVKVTLLDD